MDILQQLFGAKDKMRIIKLFLFNPESAFDIADISKRANCSLGLCRREIDNLLKMGFIRRKAYMKEVRRQKNRKMVSKRENASGFILNYKFKHLELFYNFVSEINVLDHPDLIDKISKGVNLDLLVLSGFFTNSEDSKIDMLIVGKDIKELQVEDVLKGIESEIGREIRYCLFDTIEFRYRVSVFDRLIRDVLEYPHQKVVNKINL